jgi:CRISPR system Cascade subunit CasD
MPTLLLRLCGPMQSWGTRSRFVQRETELEPSKSGVFGILCAAAGIQRAEPIPDAWLALRMGVRVETEGRMEKDYHTSGGAYEIGIVRADGDHLGNAVLSDRYYLAGADFIAALESQDRGPLEEIERALKAPHWQIFLGRKAFVPAVPIPWRGGGIVDVDLATALTSADLSQQWPASPRRRDRGQTRRHVVECGPGESHESRMDQPFADSFATRRFGERWVKTDFRRPATTGDPE